MRQRTRQCEASPAASPTSVRFTPGTDRKGARGWDLVWRARHAADGAARCGRRSPWRCASHASVRRWDRPPRCSRAPAPLREALEAARSPRPAATASRGTAATSQAGPAARSDAPPASPRDGRGDVAIIYRAFAARGPASLARRSSEARRYRSNRPPGRSRSWRLSKIVCAAARSSTPSTSSPPLTASSTASPAKKSASPWATSKWKRGPPN